MEQNQPEQGGRGLATTPTLPTTPTPKPAAERAKEIVRSELNLEKWPIWQPAKSKLPPKAKILRREITLPDGSIGTAQVEIAPTTRGALTTEDRKIFYALIKQWEERGRSDSFVPLSLNRLAKLTRKKWGTNVIDSLTASLSRLRMTAFVWTNSFFSKPTGETIETVDYFSIVSELKLVKRKSDGVITKEAGYFKFHDLLLENLKANHTKPIYLDVLLSLRGDIAQLLYTHADLILADKTRYERRSKELIFDELHLEGAAYKNQSNRKQILEPALKEITGKPLSTGVLASATLELTKDGDDYKVVFIKRAAAAMPPPDQLTTETAPLPTTAKEELSIRGEAAELVKHFHQTFHGNLAVHLNSKAIDQAVTLIAAHGFELAKFVIDFAHQEAPKTNYDPQTFGGILQYAPRALAAFEDHQRQQAEAVKREEQKAAAANCPFCRHQDGWVITPKGARHCTHDAKTEELHTA